MNLFSDEMRRDPYPLYKQLRASCPVLKIPRPFDAFAVLDYEGVKKVLNDHNAFSSGVPAPKHWFIFLDPPVHSNLRALVAKAFTPRMVSSLEPRIHELSRTLLEPLRERSYTAAQTLVPLLREQGLEVIVAKDSRSLYETGKRTGKRQKVKLYLEEEFRIGGFIPSRKVVSNRLCSGEGRWKGASVCRLPRR